MYTLGTWFYTDLDKSNSETYPDNTWKKDPHFDWKYYH